MKTSVLTSARVLRVCLLLAGVLFLLSSVSLAVAVRAPFELRKVKEYDREEITPVCGPINLMLSF